MDQFDYSSNENALRLVSGGSELAGTAVGAALGFMAAGPAGAAAAGIVGVVLNRALAYSAERLLSKRERARSGAVAAYALATIALRIERGDVPREELFEAHDGQRADGEELFEGVVLLARDEFEERKLRHLGLFYANLIFDRNVSPPLAHRLLRTISQLSYRQIVFLSIVSEDKVVDVGGLRSHSRHESAELEAMKLEEMDLLSGYIGMHGLITNYRDYDDRLSSIGKAMARLAEIDSVPFSDRMSLRELLARCPPQAPPKVRYDEPPDEE